MGLLDFATDPQSSMLTNMGLGLLSAGGPSSRPVSLGQAIGSAGQMGMEGFQQAQQNQMRQMQLGEAQRKQLALKQFREQLPPQFQATFDIAPDLVLGQIFKDKKMSYQDAGDSLIQLDSDGNPTGLKIPKGLAPSLHMVDQGDKVTPSVFQNGEFKPIGSLNKNVTPDSKYSAAVTMRGQNMTDSRERMMGSPQFQASVAGAKKTGELQATEAVALPETIAKAEMSIKQIDDLIKSPGFGQSVGAGIPGLKYVPGTSVADFNARLDQIKGSAFMQAYNALRGGGQITEIEGKKATDAITRMSTAQSEKEFKAAANEFKSYILTGVSRARMRAGTSAGIPQKSSGVQFLGFE